MEILFPALIWTAALIGLGCVCFGIYITVARRFIAGTVPKKLRKIDKVAVSTIKFLHFGEISTPYPGLVVTFFGIFLFIAATAFYFNAKKEQEMSAALNPIMIETAKNLHTEFHLVVDQHERPIPQQLFGRTIDLINLLFKLDSRNGHAIYYLGEIKRFEGNCIGSKDEFLRYIDVHDTLPESERGGDISQNTCYVRARGFCRQRTGWIQYLLAYRIYWEAMQEKDAHVRKEKLKEALRQLDDSKTSFFPSTFSNWIPAAAFEAALNEQIRSADTGGVANSIVPPNPC